MKIEELFYRHDSRATLPTRAKDKDAGFDLYSNEDIELPGLMGMLNTHLRTLGSYVFNDRPFNKRIASEIWQRDLNLEICSHRFDTGVGWKGPPNRVALGWDKSGLGDKLIKVFGGVIDETYSGPIKIRIMNMGMEPWVVKRGQKICQLVVQPVDYLGIPGLDSNPRGDAGFGSTGIFGSDLNRPSVEDYMEDETRKRFESQLKGPLSQGPHKDAQGRDIDWCDP
jgi:dUTPase